MVRPGDDGRGQETPETPAPVGTGVWGGWERVGQALFGEERRAGVRVVLRTSAVRAGAFAADTRVETRAAPVVGLTTRAGRAADPAALRCAGMACLTDVRVLTGFVAGRVLARLAAGFAAPLA
jgi:hypothetical protein